MEGVILLFYTSLFFAFALLLRFFSFALFCFDFNLPHPPSATVLITTVHGRKGETRVALA